MTTLLSEGFNHLDLEGIVKPTLSIDEYVAHMGEDKDIVTLAFDVRGKQAAQDLSSWFERGYDYVLDAKVSDGESKPGHHLVFVEMNRRSSVPERIVRLLDDMSVLTGLKLRDWTVTIDGDDYDPDPQIIGQKIATSPAQYRKEKDAEEELNEMRDLARVERVKIHDTSDDLLQQYKNIAGL